MIKLIRFASVVLGVTFAIFCVVWLGATFVVWGTHHQLHDVAGYSNSGRFLLLFLLFVVSMICGSYRIVKDEELERQAEINGKNGETK